MTIRFQYIFRLRAFLPLINSNVLLRVGTAQTASEAQEQFLAAHADKAIKTIVLLVGT